MDGGALSYFPTIQICRIDHILAAVCSRSLTPHCQDGWGLRLYCAGHRTHRVHPLWDAFCLWKEGPAHGQVGGSPVFVDGILYLQIYFCLVFVRDLWLHSLPGQLLKYFNKIFPPCGMALLIPRLVLGGLEVNIYSGEDEPKKERKNSSILPMLVCKKKSGI